jgi:DNA polymerase III delta subunit
MAKNEGTFLGIEAFDPYIERLFVHFLKKEEHFSSAILVDGRDLTHNWFDQNLASLDLFAVNDPFIITKAEKISPELFSCFMEKYAQISRKIVFLFSSKSGYFQKLVKKYRVGFFLSIQGPKFWEKEEFFRFLVRTLGMSLGRDAEAYLLKSLSEDSSRYVRALNLMKLHFGPNCEGVLLAEVKSLIPPECINSFELADLFCKKQSKAFWKKLLEIEASEGDFQEFFGFMQSHLIKLADPTYLKVKKKLTAYDRKILSQAEGWNRREIHKSLRMFGELQISAKRSFGEIKLKLKRIETRL